MVTSLSLTYWYADSNTTGISYSCTVLCLNPRWLCIVTLCRLCSLHVQHIVIFSASTVLSCKISLVVNYQYFISRSLSILTHHRCCKRLFHVRRTLFLANVTTFYWSASFMELWVMQYSSRLSHWSFLFHSSKAGSYAEAPNRGTH